jgi:hypothetical protein
MKINTIAEEGYEATRIDRCILIPRCIYIKKRHHNCEHTRPPSVMHACRVAGW